MKAGRWSLAALLACAVLFWPTGAWAEEQPAARTPTASPSPSPGVAVHQSVERVVERLEAARKDPCLEPTRQGRPCFPATTELAGGPTASVRESLGVTGPLEGWSPDRPPTTEEMGPYRTGSTRGLPPLAASVTFDPGCAAKAAVKRLKGKNDTYFLYRVRDVLGERFALYDRRLEATGFQGNLEYFGKFEGECAAVAALRHEERKK